MAGRRSRASAPTRTPAAGQVISLKPDPLAWDQAVVIVNETDGDVRRIEVLNARTVIVRNSPVR